MSRERFASESGVTSGPWHQLEKDFENFQIQPANKPGLMELHEKAFSAEGIPIPAAGVSALSGNERPRSYTADETFHVAKNWLLKKKQRRSSNRSVQHTEVPPPAFDNVKGLGLTDRSGSLSTLWTPKGKPDTLSVIVIGRPKIGKTDLIAEIVDSWCENHDNNSPSELGRSFSFDDESERIWIRTEDPYDGLPSWTKLRFVEIDYTKDDLWRTLSGHAFVVMYSAQIQNSVNDAADILTWLRMPAHNPNTPVWLVGTGAQLVEPEMKKQAFAEAKLLCQTFKCHWIEISEFNRNGIKIGSQPLFCTPRRDNTNHVIKFP